jgi:hypothetical protein
MKWLWDTHDIRLQHDDVAHDVRDRRNLHWKQTLEIDSQLGDGKHFSGIPYRDPLYMQEYPDVGSSTWAVVTFDHSTVIPVSKSSPSSPDDYMVYTELHFRVLSVVIEPVNGNSTLRENDVLDDGVEGGALSLPNGTTRKSYTPMPRFKYEIGHKYLVQALPYKDGSNSYSISACWEIRDDALYPNADDDFVRAQAGVSHLYKLSIEDATAYISSHSRFLKRGGAK